MVKYNPTNQPDAPTTTTGAITIGDEVVYTRSTGVEVPGWVYEATTAAIYIRRASNVRRIIAAPRERVRRMITA